MTAILRWPVVLLLLILVIASLFPAAATTLVQTDLVDMTAISAELEVLAENTTWLEAGLWYGAAALFLVAAIRLIRRTQAFWAWLLGFACYGARWALTQRNEEGGVLGTVQSLSVESFKPENLSAEAPALQISLLGIVLLIGLLILLIDVIDRRFWNNQS